MSRLYAVRLEPELMERARALGFESDSEVLRAGVRALLGLPPREIPPTVAELADRIDALADRVESLEKKPKPDRTYRLT